RSHSHLSSSLLPYTTLFRSYDPDAIELGVQSLTNAFALIVVGTLTTTGTEYTGDRTVGTVPSTVYRMVAPVVVDDIETVCDLYIARKSTRLNSTHLGTSYAV